MEVEVTMEVEVAMEVEMVTQEVDTASSFKN